MIVLEMVSEEVSKIITKKLSIPTIGIGAGKFCDGQVLVINDMLGITALDLRHAKKYQNYQNLTFQAICQYKEEVENGVFPNEASVVSMDEQKLARVEKWLKGSLS